jgi:hypothetical protein
MGIVNASKDSSEQQRDLHTLIKDTATGKDYVLFRAPHALRIMGASAIAVGLSGAPTATLKLQRFVVGAGLTTIAISGALTTTAIGTSGPQGFSMPASGSSLLDLAKGDVLVCTTGGSNAGLEQLNVGVVVKALQDIKSWE